MKNFTYSLVFTLCVITSVFSQTVTTITDGSPDDGIAFDSEGNIYASGFESGTIYKFTETGIGTTFVNNINNPNGIDFDSADRLYVNEWGDDKILRFLPNGSLETFITITENPSGMLKAIDNDDMIYTRYNGNTINRITPAGVITEVSSAPELNGPVGLAYDDNGTLYVGNYNDRKIYRVIADGSLSYVATVGASSNLGFIAFGQGKLWGTVLGEHKIYIINQDAGDDVTLFAGSTLGNADGDISNATFNQPNGIRFNADESVLYVTDYGSKNLRVISGITLGTHLESTEIEMTMVYPNPCDGELTIQGFSRSSRVSIQINSLEGKLLKELTFESSSAKFVKTISVTDFAAGTYFVTIHDSESSITKQWIKK